MKRLLILSLAVLCVSCSDDPNSIPHTFIIDDVEKITSSEEGANTDNIKDVWVFQDGTVLGVYPLPARIPVLPNGIPNSTLQISSGVRNNGINSSAIIYPFYTSHLIELDLTNNKEETLDLEFEYLLNTKFEFIEDFENSNLFTFDEDEDLSTGLKISTVESRGGLKSGHFDLDTTNSFIEVATSETYTDLPINGTPIFMEMDYKNTVELNVGVIGFLGNNDFKFYKLVLKPQEDWNKVYIDFTFDILDSQLEGYKIVLGAALAEGSEKADVFVDNIKLLHF